MSLLSQNAKSAEEIMNILKTPAIFLISIRKYKNFIILKHDKTK